MDKPLSERLIELYGDAPLAYWLEVDAEHWRELIEGVKDLERRLEEYAKCNEGYKFSIETLKKQRNALIDREDQDLSDMRELWLDAVDRVDECYRLKYVENRKFHNSIKSLCEKEKEITELRAELAELKADNGLNRAEVEQLLKVAAENASALADLMDNIEIFLADMQEVASVEGKEADWFVIVPEEKKAVEDSLAKLKGVG